MGICAQTRRQLTATLFQVMFRQALLVRLGAPDLDAKEVGTSSLIAFKCTLDRLVTFPVGINYRRAAISQLLSVVSGEIRSPQHRRITL
ncbi:MAG TPA: hypothetical protein VFO90_01170 [Terrimicrobiaceae bacterium]|nr:hypothetical protein [Terrimicrobiaceae bacterium]